ncbi:Lnt Apolipoprotein N-acyltransferase [Rhabdaerophilaceae bacterium]
MGRAAMPITPWLKSMRSAIGRLAERVILLEGWRRLATAFAAGAVAALALQPLNILLALVPGFALLVWLIDGSDGAGTRPRLSLLWQAFSLGWAFGFGYFLMGLWWLGSAFIEGGEQFIWLLPFGVVGLPMGLAIFMGCGVTVARVLWSGGALRLLALAFGLGLSEFARARLLTGFPWNSFGQVFADHLALAQGASLIGTEGMGVLAILMFAAPATFATGRTVAAKLVPTLSAALLLVSVWSFGYVRLIPTGGIGGAPAQIGMAPGVLVRVVQPGVTQADRSRPGSGAEILNRFLTLTESAPGIQSRGLAGVTHLIWPEAPFPFVLDREPKALAAISQRLGETVLVTGAIRAEEAPEQARRFHFFNAIQVFDRDGIVGSYDKVHLVPFGEYLPFGHVLRALGIQEFVDVIGGFTSGAARRPLEIPGLPASVPLICFETIFPHELVGHAPLSGAVFVNVTNDAWFGQTFGPYQHLAQARLRAIEFGYPMVRAANSGISAMIDPHGRLLTQLPLGKADVFDARLPLPLRTTLYRRTIQYSYASVMILIGVIAFWGVLRSRRPRTFYHV